jgi:trypsin
VADLHRRTALVAILAAGMLAPLASTLLSPASALASDLEPRIVDGLPTTTATHPWQAQLVIKGRFLCGGELISPTVVLTAAHCLDLATSPGQVRITLGRDHSARGGVVETVSAIYVNPGFQKDTLAYDWAFAVLSTAAPSQFTPLRIAGPDETALWGPGRAATVTGYGTTAENGELSRTLRAITVPVLGDGVCGSPSSYGRDFDPAAMLCAGDPQKGEDSCQGDSGGPLVVQADDGSPRLAGIVSFGRGCAEPRFPGIYTRIADPALSSQLVQQLDAQPATAGYPYLGSGGACVTTTAEAGRAGRKSRRADRAEGRARRALVAAQAGVDRARQHDRSDPGLATEHRLTVAVAARRHAATAVHAARREARQARKAAARTTIQASAACAAAPGAP